jgi:hypothetical protein
MPQYIPQTPVPIDPALSNGTEQASESTAAFFGVAVYNEVLYSVCARSSDSTIQVYRSIDNGATWQPQVPAGAPVSTNGSGTATYDLNLGIVYIAYLVGAAPGNVQVVTFNLNSSTWGTPSALSGGTANTVLSLYLRPDGSLAVIYSRNTHAGTSGIYADFLSTAGAWHGEIDAYTNITTLSGYNSTTVSVNVPGPMSTMGPDGSIYVVASFGTALSPVGWLNRVFYQRITPGNTVPADSPGSFYDFPGQGAAGSQPIEGIGKPCIANSYLLLPVSATGNLIATLYFARLDNREVTSWAATGQQIDPREVTRYPATSCAQIGPVIFDGASLFVAYLGNGNGNVAESSMRLCQAQFPGGSPATLLWSAQLVWDAAVGPNPSAIIRLSFPSIQRFGNFILVQSDGEGTPPFVEAAFWFGDWGSQYQVKITLRGVNRRRCDPGDAGVQVSAVPNLPGATRAR